jgi:hypothetical protein
MAVFAPERVDAPVVERRKGGLLSVADVRDDPSGKWMYGLDWQPEHCGTAHLTSIDCVDGPAGAKVFDGAPVVLSKAFAAYKGVACDSFDMDRYRRMARVGLEFGEAEAVERYVALNILDGGTDLTPTTGTAVPLEVGLGIIEEWTAENYGGVPIVHADRLVTTLLDGADLLIRDPVNLRTVQGSLVANGAYRVANKAGERWLWATGQVLLVRGSIGEHDALDRAKNRHYALAERPWAIGVECFLVKVLVTTTGAPAVTASPVDKSAAHPGDVFTDPSVTNKAALATQRYVAAPNLPWQPGWYITVGTNKYTWDGTAWQDYVAPTQSGSTGGPFGSAFALPFRGVL